MLEDKITKLYELVMHLMETNSEINHKLSGMRKTGFNCDCLRVTAAVNEYQNNCVCKIATNKHL